MTTKDTRVLGPENASTVFTVERIISWVARALPYSEQVNWEAISHAKDLRFEWRAKHYRITVETLFVEQLEEEDGVISIRSDEAILIEALLKKQWVLEHNSK